jgi:hypothetical protein
VAEAPLDDFDELPHAEMSTTARTTDARPNRRVIATSRLPMRGLYPQRDVPPRTRVSRLCIPGLSVPDRLAWLARSRGAMASGLIEREMRRCDRMGCRGSARHRLEAVVAATVCAGLVCAPTANATVASDQTQIVAIQRRIADQGGRVRSLVVRENTAQANVDGLN